MASQVLMTVSEDEEERARLLRDEKIEMDYRSGLSEAKREGILEGETKERQKNHNEKLEKARKALEKGIPIDVILEISGLDIEEISRLQA